MTKYQLVWFRQDLRVHDHAALWHASQQGSVIGLIFISPEQWQKHDDALIKIGLYLQQIKQLKIQLDQLNIPLKIIKSDLWKNVPEHILDCCKSLEIENVYANIELGVNELKRDAEVQKALNKIKKDLLLHHDRTIFPVATIRNKSHQPYQVFGAFKKQCYEKLSLSTPKCYPKPEKQEPVLKDIETSNIPNMIEFYPDDQQQHIVKKWIISEQKALEILDEFIENKLKNYHEKRDFPADIGTSQLSAYLNLGILSIRQCLQALFRAHQGDFHLENMGQQTWLDELLWREFYQHILFDFPKVSKHLPFKDQTQKIVWKNDDTQFDAWKYGKTGIPIIDAGMREMLATGWMHNRVRMIVAMFLSKNLLIDWRKGEQWFMQNLIDGDLAANNGGWQWCASTGTDSVPYFRIFNPISQSQKFDPNGDYLRKWLPELAHLDNKNIHAPFAKHHDIELDYPRPIVDLKQSRHCAIETFKSLSL